MNRILHYGLRDWLVVFFLAFSAMRNTKVFWSRHKAHSMHWRQQELRQIWNSYVYSIQNFVHVADLFATGKIETLKMRHNLMWMWWVLFLSFWIAMEYTHMFSCRWIWLIIILSRFYIISMMMYNDHRV